MWNTQLVVHFYGCWTGARITTKQKRETKMFNYNFMTIYIFWWRLCLWLLLLLLNYAIRVVFSIMDLICMFIKWCCLLLLFLSFSHYFRIIIIIKFINIFFFFFFFRVYLHLNRFMCTRTVMMMMGALTLEYIYIYTNNKMLKLKCFWKYLLL